MFSVQMKHFRNHWPTETFKNFAIKMGIVNNVSSATILPTVHSKKNYVTSSSKATYYQTNKRCCAS